MNDAARKRWADIRAAYEGGEGSVAAICRRFEVDDGALYRKAREQGWAMRGSCIRPKAAKPARKPGPARTTAQPGDDRRRLIARLYQSLARQMRQSEKDMAETNPSEAARERQARTLSNLTRTLEKLVELEKGLDAADKGRQERAGERRAAEALRARLAQKLLRLAARGGAEGTDQGADGA